MPRLLSKAFSAWDRLHPTVAATVAGLVCAAVLAACGGRAWIAPLDFHAILLRWLLPFLLFAGAIHVDASALRAQGGFVALLATAGVLIATASVGLSAHLALGLAGWSVPLPACLLFGALIAPTDPVAVLPILRRVNAPRGLSLVVGAESLFNDGTAVVTFSALLAASGGGGVSLSRAAASFAAQAGGGIVLGLALGALAARFVRADRSVPVKLAATAALAFAGYSAAEALGVSGLLAVAVAGIRVGSRDAAFARAWTSVDAGLNAFVFALLGIEALAIPWSADALKAAALAVPLVLAGRAASVALCMAALRPWRSCVRGTFRALTWGGLRGALPLALALGLPAGPEKGLILVAVYVVVLFSLLVQGSTL